MQSIPFKLIEKHQLENVQSIYIYMFVGQMRSKIQKVGTSMLPFVLPQGRLLGCRVKADGSAGYHSGLPAADLRGWGKERKGESPLIYFNDFVALCTPNSSSEYLGSWLSFT